MKKIIIAAATILICIFKVEAQQVLVSEQPSVYPVAASAVKAVEVKPAGSAAAVNKAKPGNNAGNQQLVSAMPSAAPAGGTQKNIPAANQKTPASACSNKDVLPSEAPAGNTVSASAKKG